MRQALLIATLVFAALPAMSAERLYLQAEHDRFATAIQAQNYDAVDIFSADAIFIPPREDPVRGRASIRAYWQNGLTPKEFKLTSEMSEQQGDQTVIEWGRWVTRHDVIVPTVTEGRYFAVWQKLAGDWKVVVAVAENCRVSRSVGKGPALLC